jgi:porphyrinogen peroxidase
MPNPQHGIFALGTASHAYLELDAHEADPRAVVEGVAALREPRTTIGGVNLVAGFAPELWRAVAPEDTPGDLTGFATPVVGNDGFRMPATQHDVLLWVSGSAYDVVFDLARGMITALGSLASVAREVASWPYHHDRDLTGFIDGTENPSLAEAADVAVVPEGTPGAGGSVLLLQKWSHDAAAWEALPLAEQERTMGRTKPDSTELDDRATDSHVARTDQDELGRIFRRNMPYGTVDDHGTMFVGFSSEQSRLHRMLERMAGCGDGVRDALTRFTQPLTGSYYFVPSLPSLRRFDHSGND